MKAMKRSLVVLTGAGISQESGISTFRDKNGLWENHKIEDVASPEGFRRNPELVHRFYNLRRAQLKEVHPNPAHRALVELERRWTGDFLLVTQNVDDLHARAGSEKLVHMHGELRKARCETCEAVHVWEGEITQFTACPICQKTALRPHIVWFGEMPFQLDKIYSALEVCDIFLAVGTSGHVYPAAGFVSAVPRQARKIELNAESTPVSRSFDEYRQGKAGIELPRLVNELLEGR